MSSKIYSDPDLQRLSDKAFRYWVNLLAWCSHHDTDGTYQFAGKAPKHIQELVDRGRLVPTDDPFSYTVVGWDKWQKSNADREEERRQSRERTAKHRGVTRDTPDPVTRYSRATPAPSNGEVPSLVSSSLVLSGVGGPGGGGFAEWYAIYPLHVGRKAAERAYGKAIDSGVSHETLCAAALAYRNNPRRKSEYTAHPATWLNQGRWEDDPKAADPDRMATVNRLAGEMEGSG